MNKNKFIDSNISFPQPPPPNAWHNDAYSVYRDSAI